MPALPKDLGNESAGGKTLIGKHGKHGMGEGDGSLNCAGYGSVVTVTSTFGMCAAGVILDRIAGK